MKKLILIVILFIISYVNNIFAIEFTQKDRDRLIRLETKLDMFMKQVDERFKQVDERFKQVDERFKQVDKQFDRMITFMWILAAIFTAIMAANMGFMFWDRRTMIRKAKEETIEKLEREGKLHNLIEGLKEYAKKNKKLAAILHEFHIL